MRQQNSYGGVLVLSIFLLVSGCATQRSPAAQQPQQPQQTQQTQQPIPSDSPLAKIRQGMGKAEVIHLLGPPTDETTNLTGKVFIPFYFGPGQSLTRLHYKGVGRVYIAEGAMFTGRGGGVVKIEYDPQESGFR